MGMSLRVQILKFHAVVPQDLVDEVATAKYEHCYYDNTTYEHSGFRFQVVNDSLWVEHLPWHNYEGGVVSHALTVDKYNQCALQGFALKVLV